MCRMGCTGCGVQDVVLLYLVLHIANVLAVLECEWMLFTDSLGCVLQQDGDVPLAGVYDVCITL